MSSGPVTRPVKEITRQHRPHLRVRVVRRFYRGPSSRNKYLEIENNHGKFLTSLHKLRIVFQPKTHLVDLPEEFFFPEFMFDFCDFATLVDPDTIDETLLFDVVGKVTEIHEARDMEFSGNKTKLMEIVLENLRGMQLRCTLWGDYVDEIPRFEANIRSGAPVIILQLCRAKVRNGKKLDGSLSSIPDDVIFYEIFPRLPIKSLHRFRCIARSFRGLTSERRFLDDVRRYAPRRQLISFPRLLPLEIDLYHADFAVIPYSLGAIPATAIQDPFTNRCIYINIINGFMYIYKVLRTMTFRTGTSSTTALMRYSIFTLRYQRWVCFDHHGLLLYGDSRSICIDGILYLNKFREDCGRHVMGRYSVQSDSFSTMLYPNGLCRSKYDDCHFIELNGSLAIIDIHFVMADGITIWLKKKGSMLDDGSSWVEQTIKFPIDWVKAHRICARYYFSNNLNGEIVMGKTSILTGNDCWILIYNVDNNTWREIKVLGIVNQMSSGPVTRPVKEITRQHRPHLRVRVVRRFYRGPSSRNKYLEIVFHDLEGGRITAVVKPPHLSLFDQRLVQGRVYGIKTNTYHLENNHGKFLTSLHKLRIVFQPKTHLVDLLEEFFFPEFMFDFRDFATLVDPDTIDETLLFDVIGKVTEIHEAREMEFSGNKTKLMEIVLENLRGMQLRCTLWGDYVDEILRFEANIRSVAPVIILQLCRAKVRNGEKLDGSLSSIPDDVIFYEIFPRLPIKSLHRFRCIARSFRGLTSEHRFLDVVRRYAPRRQLISFPRLLPLEIDLYHAGFAVIPYSLGAIPATAIQDPFTNRCIYINIINGFMCRANESRNVVIMNNATNEVSVLPNYEPHHRCEQHYVYFVYDYHTDIYKVLRTMTFRTGTSSTTALMRYSIFTLRYQRWVCFDHHGLLLYGDSRSVCIDGILYLNKFREDCGRHVMGIYSVQSDSFSTMLYPNGLCRSKYDDCHFIELNGSLAIIDIHFVMADGITIWLKKKGSMLDDGSSWVEQTIKFPIDWVKAHRICARYYFSNNLNGEIVMGKTSILTGNDCWILIYNVDNNTWREIKVLGIVNQVICGDLCVLEYFETPLLLSQILHPK
ncbi:hypothetical protein CASFOL_007644 [Castilleja foliolosa]|uniref:F-box domain-containing protein n=1 Tax=Castilleja foliolosa TaxID=1961234 RepID=A0ABD3E558_9LAMI